MVLDNVLKEDDILNENITSMADVPHRHERRHIRTRLIGDQTLRSWSRSGRLRTWTPFTYLHHNRIL